MAGRSRIEWTESTWNPVTGCTKVSAGCANCYAERLARRLQAMGQPNYVNGFEVTLHHHALTQPLNWRQPQMIFVNSMSDLFHEDVPEEFIRAVFEVMRKAKHHTFQILTKRSNRLVEIAPEIEWTNNVWVGVSVENQAAVGRINDLRNSVGPSVCFVSMEPLLGAIEDIDLSGIDWVIVGGESGPRARPMKKEWALSVRDQCLTASVPFFFKQWGGTRKKVAGRLLEGRTWDEMPIEATEVFVDA